MSGRYAARCNRSWRPALIPVEATSHNLDAGRTIVRITLLPKNVTRMIRYASLLAVALAYLLAGHAARAQVSTAELLTRIDRLEAAIRDLTGNIEQLQYRNQQLEQQLRHLEAEVAPRADAARSTPAAPPPRPAGPAGGPVAAASGPPPPVPPTVATAPESPPSAPPPGRRADVFDPSANPGAPGMPRPLGALPGAGAAGEPASRERSAGVTEAPAGTGAARPVGAPLDLSTLSSTEGGSPASGELPPPPPRNTSATGAIPATLPPSNSPKDEYDLAYGYVLHKDYGLAADAFRTFLRHYPSDRMAPEAQYWLGESLFQQQQYRDAAESFLAASTKYESTARAPEALLRLGQSLAALGEKEAACASLGEVLRKYPRASQSVKQSVEREQKRVRC